MARQFLGLYLLVVFTLAIVSWGQDKLLQAYSGADIADDKPVATAMAAVADRLHEAPPASWHQIIARIGAQTGVSLDLFTTHDITGTTTLNKLKRGDIAYMEAGNGESWALRRLDDSHVLAIKSIEPASRRGP